MAKAIYVDIDDTLVRSVGAKRIPIPATIALVRALRSAGAVLYAWSAGGADYAKSSATELGLADCFEAFLPKPNALIDDCDFDAWRVPVIHPAQCASTSSADVLARAR